MTDGSENERRLAAIRLEKFLSGKNPLGQRIPYKIAASAVRCSEASISRYVDGIAVPDWPTRWIIERWTRGYVKAMGWCDDHEQDRIDYANTIRPLAPARGKTKKETKK